MVRALGHGLLSLRRDDLVVFGDDVGRRVVAFGSRARCHGRGHRLGQEPAVDRSCPVIIDVGEQGLLDGLEVVGEPERSIVMHHVVLHALLAQGRPQQVHCRLAAFGPVRGQVDAVADGRVVGEFGDHHAAVGVAEEGDRTVDRIDEGTDVCSVVLEIAEVVRVRADAGELVNHDRVATVFLQDLHDLVPVPAPHSTSVNSDQCVHHNPLDRAPRRWCEHLQRCARPAAAAGSRRRPTSAADPRSRRVPRVTARGLFPSALHLRGRQCQTSPAVTSSSAPVRTVRAHTQRRWGGSDAEGRSDRGPAALPRFVRRVSEAVAGSVHRAG